MKAEILMQSYRSPFQQLQLSENVIYCEPCNKISRELLSLENCTQNPSLPSKPRFLTYCKNCDETTPLKKSKKRFFPWGFPRWIFYGHKNPIVVNRSVRKYTRLLGYSRILNDSNDSNMDSHQYIKHKNNFSLENGLEVKIPTF